MTDKREMGLHLQIDQNRDLYRLTVLWASNGAIINHTTEIDRFQVHKAGVRSVIDEMKKSIELIKHAPRDLAWPDVTKALDDAYKAD